MCGHTFHPHIVYLRALLVRNRRLFFRICFVASCEMAVAGRTGPNAVGIMPKVHDMWVNSLAALLGALAAIRSRGATASGGVTFMRAASSLMTKWQLMLPTGRPKSSLHIVYLWYDADLSFWLRAG